MTLKQLARYTPKSKQVERFFMDNAKCYGGTISYPGVYRIQVGSKLFHDNDTMNLRIQLENAIRRERRKLAKKATA